VVFHHKYARFIMKRAIAALPRFQSIKLILKAACAALNMRGKRITVSRDYSTLLLFFNTLSNTQNLIAGTLSHRPYPKVKEIRRAPNAGLLCKFSNFTCLQATIYVSMVLMKQHQMTNTTVFAYAPELTSGGKDTACTSLIV